MRKTFLFLAASCFFVVFNTMPAQAQNVLLTSDAVKNHLQSEADFLQDSAKQASEELDLKSNGGKKELSISNFRAVAGFKLRTMNPKNISRGQNSPTVPRFRAFLVLPL